MNENLLKKDCLKGRINRSGYWKRLLLKNLGILGILIIGVRHSSNSEVGSLFSLIFFITSIILFIASIILTILIARLRLHDSGKSGWYLLLSWIPFVNFYIAYLLLFKAGDKKPNKYDIQE